MSTYNREPDYPGQTPANLLVPENEADRLLYVLDGWLSTDDWGMPTLPYPENVRDILQALRDGADPRILREHAKHTGPICERVGCADKLAGYE